jgi:hypothetical protein
MEIELDFVRPSVEVMLPERSLVEPNREETPPARGLEEEDVG